MQKFLYLVKSNITEARLRGFDTRHLATINFHSMHQDGVHTVFELTDVLNNNPDKLLFLTVIEVAASFVETRIDSKEKFVVVLYKGDVYKFANELQYKALTGLSPSPRPTLRSGTLAG